MVKVEPREKIPLKHITAMIIKDHVKAYKTQQAAADALDISLRTVRRYVRYLRLLGLN